MVLLSGKGALCGLWWLLLVMILLLVMLLVMVAVLLVSVTGWPSGPSVFLFLRSGFAIWSGTCFCGCVGTNCGFGTASIHVNHPTTLIKCSVNNTCCGVSCVWTSAQPCGCRSNWVVAWQIYWSTLIWFPVLCAHTYAVWWWRGDGWRNEHCHGVIWSWRQPWEQSIVDGKRTSKSGAVWST